MRNIRIMSRCALFAALMAVCAWIAVPVPPVGFTLQTLGVLLTLGLLGPKWGSLSIGLYLMLGFIGLPVFAGFRGGPGALLDATGGFLWGFLLAGPVYGLTNPLGKLPAMAAAQLCCYVCGCLWFSRWANCGLPTAVMACVVPWVLSDAVKLWLAWRLQKRLTRFISPL